MKQNFEKSYHSYFILFAIALLLCVFTATGVSADPSTDEEFAALIKQFEQDGSIPEVNGTFITVNDFEATLADMGSYTTIPLFSAEHFVISTDLSWDSANQTPNSVTSGCGVLFNSAADSSNMMMAALLMDGSLYLYGTNEDKPLYYGKYYYKNPSIIGNARMTMIVNGDRVIVYLNGQRIMQKSGMIVPGDTAGFTILSGTYQGYGTHCEYKDIHIYTWD